jgi:hypothetical protein
VVVKITIEKDFDRQDGVCCKDAIVFRAFFPSTPRGIGGCPLGTGYSQEEAMRQLVYRANMDCCAPLDFSDLEVANTYDFTK